MMIFVLPLLVLLAASTVAQIQTTYTGCHNHSSTEFCYNSEGSEVAVWTYTDSTTPSATLPVSVSAIATSTGQTTAVTSCHPHGVDVYCINGNGDEVLVSLTATLTGEPPAAYTGCHAHDTEQYCVDPNGEDVLVIAEGLEDSHDHDGGEEEEGELDCHFHAGVEHCVRAGQESCAPRNCNIQQRDYNVPLRIGTLFVVLVTSCLGVFAPMFLSKLPFASVNGLAFTIIKQFGTGIIVSTAFVHLYTHAYLMFTNECLGRLDYEATTSALVMAGLFVAWLIEYVGHRFVMARSPRTLPPTVTDAASDQSPAPPSEQKTGQATLVNLGHHHGNSYDPTNPNTKLSVMVMEAGILFHSILIGLTLVVAGDSFYRTLLVVIIFHQFFEGLALGARIALLPGRIWWQKFTMGLAFGLITPLGMAIGLGVLSHFNGNDSATIITIGTLDAVSAGILIWVGLVDMWARDWVIEGGEMVDAKAPKALAGGLSLIAGLVLMSLLGKWA